MLILAFVHALELKLHNIGKPVIDLRDLSTFAVYRVHRTLLPAPLQATTCTAPWFLHGDGLSRPPTKLAPYCNSSGTEDFLNWDDETAVAASCAGNSLRCRAGE